MNASHLTSKRELKGVVGVVETNAQYQIIIAIEDPLMQVARPHMYTGQQKTGLRA
jgi:phosphotransferase system IIB component